MSTADRGKDAERQVQEVLDEVKGTCAQFDYNRQLDARAARGKFPAQVGDFAWYLNIGTARSGIIEVKEVGHDYRLPKKNFPNDEIARMRRRQWAGQSGDVLVLHTTTQLWRRVPLQYFIDNLSNPSWDLRGFETTKDISSCVINQVIGK